MTEHKEKENSYMLMEIYMKVSGRMIKPVDLAYIRIAIILNTKATG